MSHPTFERGDEVVADNEAIHDAVNIVRPCGDAIRRTSTPNEPGALVQTRAALAKPLQDAAHPHVDFRANTCGEQGILYDVADVLGGRH